MRCAAVATLVVGVLVGNEYTHTRRHPVEQATVVAVRSTDHRIDCSPSGRSLPFPNEYEQLTTYRVTDPPPGLPALFTVKDCPDESRPGQGVSVVRVGNGPDAEVYISPPRSLSTVTLSGLGAGAVVGGSVFSWFRLEIWWRRWRERGRHEEIPAAIE